MKEAVVAASDGGGRSPPSSPCSPSSQESSSCPEATTTTTPVVAPTPPSRAAEDRGAITFAEAEEEGLDVTFEDACNEEDGRLFFPSYFRGECYANVDDNGGATDDGVTADTIRVGGLPRARRRPDPRLHPRLDPERRHRRRRPGDLRRPHRDVQRPLPDLRAAVEPVFIEGSGDATDAEAGRADAIRAAEEGVFAAWGGPALNAGWSEELNARGILCIGCFADPGARAEHLHGRRPARTRSTSSWPSTSRSGWPATRPSTPVTGAAGHRAGLRAPVAQLQPGLGPQRPGVRRPACPRSGVDLAESDRVRHPAGGRAGRRHHHPAQGRRCHLRDHPGRPVHPGLLHRGRHAAGLLPRVDHRRQRPDGHHGVRPLLRPGAVVPRLRHQHPVGPHQPGRRRCPVPVRLVPRRGAAGRRDRQRARAAAADLLRRRPGRRARARRPRSWSRRSTPSTSSATPSPRSASPTATTATTRRSNRRTTTASRTPPRSGRTPTRSASTRSAVTGPGSYMYVDGGRRFLPGTWEEGERAFDPEGAVSVYEEPPEAEEVPDFDPPGG